MAGCSVKTTAPTVNGAYCTVTIELRANAADEFPLRSFPYTFPITDSLADVKRKAVARIAEEWALGLAETARKAREATVLAALTDATFNVTW